jgi:hypothetical protein
MRKIQVTQHYRGVLTQEQVIAPGVYEVGDPRLFGIEDYLVNDQGKAHYWPDEDDEVDIEPEDDDLSDEGNLDDEIDPNADPDLYHNWKRDRLEAELTANGIDLSNREGGGSGGSLLKGDLITIYEREVLLLDGESSEEPEE